MPPKKRDSPSRSPSKTIGKSRKRNPDSSSSSSSPKTKKNKSSKSSKPSKSSESLIVTTVRQTNYYDIFMEAKKYEARKKRFTNLDEVTHMDCIGKDSVNGTIFKLTYAEQDNMQSNAILKSSKNSNADSLVYEYEVGQFINKQCRIFPCFLETYGLFFFKDETEWRRVSKIDSCSAVKLNSSLVLTETVDYDKACENSKHAVIIIQNIETTFKGFEDSNSIFG